MRSRFVLVLGQGRSGSTLINRLLNQAPGVHISGENYRAIDHLREFVKCMSGTRKDKDNSMYSIAWSAPPGINRLSEYLQWMLVSLYNPEKDYAVFGFKEIRYGKNYHQMCDDLKFFQQIFPSLRIIFNVRDTENCAKSSWWANNIVSSAKTLETMRASFEKYHADNPTNCYWMPYEELRKGSTVLRGMYDFLDIAFKPEYERELDIVKR